MTGFIEAHVKHRSGRIRCQSLYVFALFVVFRKLLFSDLSSESLRFTFSLSVSKCQHVLISLSKSLTKRPDSRLFKPFPQHLLLCIRTGAYGNNVLTATTQLLLSFHKVAESVAVISVAERAELAPRAGLLEPQQPETHSKYKISRTNDFKILLYHTRMEFSTDDIAHNISELLIRTLIVQEPSNTSIGPN